MARRGWRGLALIGGVAASVVAFGSAGSLQNAASAAAESAILRGTVKGAGSDLFAGGGEDAFLTNGAVYALSGDGSTLLGLGRLAKSPPGLWEIRGLPKQGRVILVGFAQGKGLLYWTSRVEMNGRAARNIGVQYAARADNQYKGSDRSAFLSNPVLGTLVEAGWVDKASWQTETDAGRLARIARALEERATAASANPAPAAPGKLAFTRVPPQDGLVGDPIAIAWTAPYPETRVRYKLDMPGDWMGGIQYALNKWSGYGTERSISFRGFVLQGNYTFTVETTEGERIVTKFRLRFEPPEVYEEAATINWSRVRRATSERERYQALSEEYQQGCDLWQARFEQERKVLNLTIDPREFLAAAAGAVAEQAAWESVLRETARSGVSASLKRLWDGRALYDIARQLGIDAVLIYRNARANRAAFSAVLACNAAEGLRRMAQSAPGRPLQREKPRPDPRPVPSGNASLQKGVSSSAVDLVFCIDTTGSMADDIDAVKASAAGVIDQLFALSSSPRVAMVAYRDYGDEYLTKGYPFTTDKEQMRRAILSLTVGGGGDHPEAVYEGLLHAINTVDIGPWRDGVKKVIVLMGDAPPHNKRHSADEVVKRAEEVDPAHIFPIAVAGATPAVLASFGELAARTGGVMTTTASAADLPGQIIRTVQIGVNTADIDLPRGEVASVMGDALEVRMTAGAARVRGGMRALIFSADTPGLLIAEGQTLAIDGDRLRVDVTAAYGTEQIQRGCRVQVIPED
jgi:Mg-chelatase subunit ChlD